jgi:hypothetical protein
MYWQARAGELGFLTCEENWNDSKDKKNVVQIEVLCILETHWWKVTVGVSGFLTFKNIWHDLNYNNGNNFLGFKLSKKYAYWIPLYIRSCCWKNDMLSFQIKASHLHIGLKWLCQPEIGYATLIFFQNQHTYYQIALFNTNGGRTWKSKWIQHNSHIFISISISCVCRLAHFTSFGKCQGVDKQYVGIIEEQDQQIKQLQKELARLIVPNIEHCQQMQAGGRMFWVHQRRWVWPQ